MISADPRGGPRAVRGSARRITAVRRTLVVVTAAAALGALAAGIPLGCADDPNAGISVGGDAGPAARRRERRERRRGRRGCPATEGRARARRQRSARRRGLLQQRADCTRCRRPHHERDVRMGRRRAPLRCRAPGCGASGRRGRPRGDGTPTQLFNPLLHVANLVLSDSRMAVTLTRRRARRGRLARPRRARCSPARRCRARRSLRSAHRLRPRARSPMSRSPRCSSAARSTCRSATTPAKHAAFATFVTRAAAHAHAVRPGLTVGFTVTADGAVARKDRLAAAWAAADVVGVTYLPIDAVAHVRSASEVAADVDRLVAALPAGKPILVREAGYPTAAASGSNEAAQAAFVTRPLRRVGPPRRSDPDRDLPRARRRSPDSGRRARRREPAAPTLAFLAFLAVTWPAQRERREAGVRRPDLGRARARLLRGPRETQADPNRERILSCLEREGRLTYEA